MTALYVILAIILFFVLVLSIKISVIADYSNEFILKIKYLFLTIPVYPRKGEKKPKKEKKEEPPKQEEPKAKPVKEKKTGNNPIKNFYNNEGVSGIIALVKEAARIMGGFFGGIFRHVIFEKLFIDLTVAGNDAADTAIKYGKVCAALFPSLGLICSKAKVKEYDVDVSPDFLATKNTAELYAKVSFRPIFLIGAAFALAVKMLFKVVFKLLFSKPKSSDNNINQNKIKQGGAQ